MSLGLKAIPVGLHHIDALALGSAPLVDLIALAIISVEKVDTSYTARVLVGHVNVKLKGASAKLRPENRVVFLGLVVAHKEAVVALDVEEVL